MKIITCNTCEKDFEISSCPNEKTSNLCPTCKFQADLTYKKEQLKSLQLTKKAITSSFKPLKDEITTCQIILTKAQANLTQAEHNYSETVKSFESIDREESILSHEIDIMTGAKKIEPTKSRTTSKSKEMTPEAALKILAHLSPEERAAVLTILNK